MTHICVSNLTIIGRRQAIIWTNAGILLIGPLGTNFNEILIKILILSFRKMRLKVSSGKWRPFCLGLNVLKLEHGLLVSFHNSMFMSSLIHVISLMLFELIPVGKKILPVNTLRPRQNCRHLTDDTFKCISLNGNIWISLKISLKYVSGVRIKNIPALV